MRRAFLSTILAGAALLPSLAKAQATDAPHDLGTVGAIELRRTAECLIGRSPTMTARLLDAQPYSRDEVRRANALTGAAENCMTGYVDSLNWGMFELRGFVAEALYLRDHPVDADFATLAHPEVLLPSDWDLQSRDVHVVLATHMQEFGNCVAAADPQGVATMIRTGVRTSAERAAIDRLRPVLGNCLLQGRTFRVDAAILRALTAQGLHRSLPHWQGTAASTNVAREAAE